MSENSMDENTYFIDPASEAELTRLIKQDILINRRMDLVPDGFVPQQGTTILDLACGPGGWVLEVLNQFPQARIIGVDIEERMIAFAKAQARSRGQENVSFQQMNILKPLDFPDASFHLVNARLLQGFMLNSLWRPVIKECLRITKPGGLLRMTEMTTITVAGCPLNHQLFDITADAFWQAQKAFSNREYAITPMLGQFLVQEGFQVVQEKSYALNFSYGAELYQPWVQDMPATLHLIKPFILKYNSIAANDLDMLCAGVLREMLDTTFRCYWHFTSVIGKKPE